MRSWLRWERELKESRVLIERAEVWEGLARSLRKRISTLTLRDQKLAAKLYAKATEAEDTAGKLRAIAKARSAL
jgi:hypothetical protein